MAWVIFGNSAQRPFVPGVFGLMFEWWELACQRCRRRCFPAQARCSHRRQAGSHRRLGTKWHGSFSVSVRFARSAQGLFASCLNGGCWLASDAGDAVFLRKRGAAIAGKPAPTGLGTKWHGSFSVTVRFARSAQGFFASCLNGGSWLASDAGDAVFLRKRSRAIAGKPAPTGDWALSGMGHFR